jgi:chromosome segregation ATPase
MKNLLQNLLIGFALALCVLVGVQWHREVKLQQQVQTLANDLQAQRAAAAAQAASVKLGEAEILRLDALKNQFAELVKSNQTEIARLQSGLAANTATQAQIDAFKQALDTANVRIQKQNESITAQNETMKKLATEHNELVEKFNRMAGEYGELVQKWNAQQEQLNKTAPPAKSRK